MPDWDAIRNALTSSPAGREVRGYYDLARGAITHPAETARAVASGVGNAFMGEPGSFWTEHVSNPGLALARAMLGGAGREDELTRIREGWEERFPGVYSAIPEVQEEGRRRMHAETLAGDAPNIAPIINSALRRALTARSAEMLNDPPTRIEDFVPIAEFRKRYRSQYVGPEGAIPGKSSLYDRSTETLPPGTWVIDDMNGIHGREIGYVTEVDPTTVSISEHLPEREPEVQRYAGWMREGHRPPPVEAMETDKGTLKISDGHRRRRAAIAAQQPLPAIVYPTGPHPRGAVAYGETEPMRVGLTFEMLQDILKKQGTP